MDCQRCHQALSAATDGELTPDEAVQVEAHLGVCAACRAHRAALAGVNRALRVRPADRVPDLVEPIMVAAQLPTRSTVPDWSRYALLAVALLQLVSALPPLLLGRDPGASIHIAHELGSVNVALAAGLLLAAWQPRRISGLLPVSAALTVALIVTAVADVAAGRAVALAETQHLLEVLGLLFLWLAGRRHGPGPVVPLVRWRAPSARPL